jgi:hypothetical protein
MSLCSGRRAATVKPTGNQSGRNLHFDGLTNLANSQDRSSRGGHECGRFHIGPSDVRGHELWERHMLCNPRVNAILHQAQDQRGSKQQFQEFCVLTRALCCGQVSLPIEIVPLIPPPPPLSLTVNAPVLGTAYMFTPADPGSTTASFQTTQSLLKRKLQINSSRMYVHWAKRYMLYSLDV